jgi:hypothetical protein
MSNRSKFYCAHLRLEGALATGAKCHDFTKFTLVYLIMAVKDGAGDVRTIHRYLAFGLHIASEMPLPELASFAAPLLQEHSRS